MKNATAERAQSTFFRVYRFNIQSLTRSMPIQPTGTRLVWWRPTWLQVFPPHHINLRFFFYWIFSRLRVFRNDKYAVLIIEDDEGQPVHRTCVFPGWFRFPFIKHHDIQLGNIYTVPHWRRRGLGIFGARYCLARIGAGNIFYIADEANKASHLLAEKLGLSLFEQGAQFPGTCVGHYRLLPTATGSLAAQHDFSSVTELAGEPISKAQLYRLVQRYVWANEHINGRDVLDVACGAGVGMALFSSNARRVVGSDIDEGILRRATAHYGGRFAFCRCDAQALPFRSGSFDVLTMFEALYYLSNPERFLKESHRLLRPGGYLLISIANKDLFDFNHSRFSYKYLNAPELARELANAGFSTEFFAGDPVDTASLRDKLFRLLRFAAARLKLIPRSMSGKKILRRLVFGKLEPMPAELTGMETRYEVPVRIQDNAPDHKHRILYCLATRR